ncbi:hypothetical protein GQ42DRAFT_177822 [Ramicandelaber brevisporus]|nr:hypothetical protein GQ42DRAFT_177822 [Ramicandelaber brevisporus]
MSHHAPNTKLMLIVGSWKSDNSHRFKDLVSPFAPVTTVSEFRTSITSAVSGKITSASCEIPKKTYKYNGREWTGRISELYGYSNQAAMRARVRYVPGGGSINRDINGAAGIVIQSLHVSAMTAVSWQQNLETIPVEQYYHPRYQRHSSRAKPSKRSHGYHMHQVQLREDARWRRFVHNASERKMLRRQILDDSVEIQQSIASAKSSMAAAKERLKNALVACAATKATRRWRVVRDVRDVRHEAQQIVKYQRAIRNLDARHEHNVKRYMFLMGHVLGNTSIRQYIAYKERQRQAQPIGDEILVEKTENDSNETQQNAGKMEIDSKNWKEIKKQKAKPRKALELDFSRKLIDVTKQMRTFPLPAKKIYRYLDNKIIFDARAHDLAATNHEAASQMANGCAPSANLLGMFVGVVFYGTELLSLTPQSLVTNPTASFNDYGVRKVTFNSLPKLRGLYQQFEKYNFAELLKIDSSYWGPHKLANPGYLNAVRASGANTLKEVIEDAVGQGITLITSQSTDSISSDTPVGNEENKAHGSIAIGSGTVRNAMMYLGKLASICATASITINYLDLYNSMYKEKRPLTKFRDQLLRFLPPGQRDMDINNAAALAHAVWPQIYPFSTIMFTDYFTYNNASGYLKTLSLTSVKNELVFKKLLPKLSKQLRGLVFAVIAINSNDKVKLNELWNMVCSRPAIKQLTAQQEEDVIKKAGIPDVEIDDIQDDDEEEVEDDDSKKVFVDNNNIPLRELLEAKSQFTVGVNSKLKDVVEGVVSVFVDQFGRDIVNFARRKRCHKQIGNDVDCSKVLVALYAISFFQASFFLGLDKTGRFIPDADRSHYAQILAIDNYNEVPTVTSAREINAEFMQLLRKRFPVLYVLPAVPGDHKTTNIKVDHYLSLGKHYFESAEVALLSERIVSHHTHGVLVDNFSL